MIAHDWRNSNAVVFEPANAAAREQSVANSLRRRDKISSACAQKLLVSR